MDKPDGASVTARGCVVRSGPAFSNPRVRRAMEKLLAAATVALCILVSGCSRSSETPQQKFAQALMHGNSMQASQIWLNMSPEDRLKFARGQGLSANPKAAEEAKRQILKHYENQAASGGAAGGEQLEEQVPTPLGNSLQRFPALAAHPPVPPTPANPPPQ